MAPITSDIARKIRCLVLFVVAMLLVCPSVEAQKKRKQTQKQQPKVTRSVETVKKEQNVAQRKISETSSRIGTTGAELKKQLNRLNTLNADIETSNADITRIRTHIDSIGSRINATSDSIAVLERQLVSLRAAYVDALRRLQPTAGHLNTISFIFSARSFSEAWARVRYLRRFSRWREDKARDIDDAIDRIAERRQHLTGLRHAQDKAFREAENVRQKLARQQQESRQIVTSLRSKDKELRAELAAQKQKAAALDRELDRLIAAEQERMAKEEAARKKKEQDAKRKGMSGSTTSGKTEKPSTGSTASPRAEERVAVNNDASKLSGSFAANKGKLLFPVAGSYKIIRRFGRQPHPTLKHVMTDNAGIDIETSGGTAVRSVYGGTVSAIFKQDGFNSIVMLRHGSYLTVYAGLGAVSVRKGDTVKAGQNLGTLFADSSNDGKGTLHFEIRDERRKLNPLLWVK